jgi:Na+/H+-dicarboxylate symporter
MTPTTLDAPTDGTIEALTGLIIGLVNMNVVGTVSQYLVFAVFLALAITKLTPSKKDDEFVQRILDAVQNKTKKD